MSDDDDKIKKLPVRFKKPGPEGRTFVEPYEIGKRTCHHPGPYIVDGALDTVECAQCGEKLNPMWVLKEITRLDSRLHRAHERYKDEMKRLSERSRTKCRSCGQMTPVSSR